MPTVDMTVIEDLLAHPRSGKRYADVYDYVYQSLTVDGSPKEGVDPGIWQWFYGASQVNRGVGPFSEFIRQYTAAQSELRTGRVLGPDELQQASDLIAQAVIEDLRTHEGVVPSLRTLGVVDASGTASSFFNDNPAGWSGNPLFVMLGDDFFLQNNILERPGDTYDLAAMLAAFGMAGFGPASLGSYSSIATQTLSLLFGAGATISPGDGFAAQRQIDTFFHKAYGAAAPGVFSLASGTGGAVLTGFESKAANIDVTVVQGLVVAGSANDRIVLHEFGGIVDGGAGRNSLVYDNDSNIRMTIGTAREGALSDAINPLLGHITYTVLTSQRQVSLFNIQDVTLGAGDNVLTIGSLATVSANASINAGNGDDEIDARDAVAPVRVDFVHGTLTQSGRGIGVRSFEKARGSSGNDTFVARGTETAIDGGAGRDVVDYSSLSHGIVLDALKTDFTSVEKFVGTASADVFDLPENVIFADEAIDVDAGGGTDLVRGNDAANRIWGGDGADVLFGNGGKDTIDGEGGDDQLSGGDDDDNLSGGDGDDVILGGDGVDVVNGGAGNDRIVGGLGEDRLYGGSGDDRIDAASDDGPGGIGGIFDRSSADRLYGGQGADTFLTNNGDAIADPDGSDRVLLDGVLLTGGTRDKNDPLGVYKGQDGTTYAYDGGKLTITSSGLLGSTITLEHFRNGAAGIRLRTKDTQDGQRLGESQASPIVIDLDGDGVRPTSLAGSNVYFDIDGDGFAERTSWISAGDGLLAVDRDGDGRIGSVTELFGTNPLIRPRFGTDSVGSAFAQLAEYDGNGDGVVDARDAGFAELRIWRDANGDGQTDEGELTDLAAVGIAAVGLDYARVNIYQFGDFRYQAPPPGGWTLFDRGRATTTDGRTVEASDVFFAVDQFSSFSLSQADPAALAAVAGLPFLIGTGNVRDLDDAMARDPLLRAMATRLAATEVGDLAGFMPQVMDLVLRWTGADRAWVEGRGGNVNGQWLAALEAINGVPYDQHGSSNPHPNGGSVTGRTFNEHLGYVGAALLGQTAAGQAILPGLSFEGGAFFTVDPDQTIGGLLASAAAHAPRGLSEAIGYWQLIVNVLDQARGEFRLTLAEVDAAIAAAMPAALSPFTIDQIRTAIWTTAGSPVAIGNSGFASGLDTGGQGIDGAAFSNNLFVIRGGASTIYDGTGADRYVISGEHVHATINDYAFNGAGEFRPPSDLVVFERSRYSDLSFTFTEGGREFGNYGDLYGRQVFNVVIRDESRDITVTLNRAISSSWNGVDVSVDALRFADGAELTLRQIWSQTQRGPGDDIVFASPDVAEDGAGGNDLLVGSAGDDIFLLREGSGRDRIIDGERGDSDTLRVDATLETVRFDLSQDFDRNELVVALASGDRVTIVAQTTNAEPVIARFAFLDGRVLSAAEVYAIALGNTPGDDRIVGTRQADVLDGGAGDDVLEGRGGDDLYRFAAGSGHDRIIEPTTGFGSGGRNRLEMTGIAFADVTLDRVGAGGRDLRLSLADGRDSIVIEGLFDRTGAIPVVEIAFADGVRPIAEVVSALAPPGITAEGTTFGEILFGTGGNDVLAGRGGDDLLVDEGGSDDYVFARGDGADRIEESGFGRDRIVFSNDVALGDLVVTRDGNDLVIGYGKGDAVTIVGGYSPVPGSDPRPIEEIARADGAWRLAVTVADGVVSGSDGDDLLVAAYGGGYFVPGAGTDVIVTDSGDDRIRLDRGFGTKVITQSAGQDGIEFGPDISADDLYYARDGRDLVISLDDGSSLRWAGYFEVSNPMSLKGDWGDFPSLSAFNEGFDDAGLGGDYDVALDRIDFADGSFVDWRMIDALFFQPDGSDQLILRSSVLDGGAGDDVLEGDSADNTYVFGVGYGHDVVRDFEGGTVGDFLPPVALRVASSSELQPPLLFPFPGGDSHDVVEIRGDLQLDDLQFEITGEHDGDVRISIVGTDDSILIDRDAVRRDGARSGEIEGLVVGGVYYDFDTLLGGLVRATDGDDVLRVPSSRLLVDALGGSDLIELGHAGGRVLFSGAIGTVGDIDRVRFADDVTATPGTIDVEVDGGWDIRFDPVEDDLANALTFRPDVVGDRIDLVIALGGRSLRVEGGIGMAFPDGSYGSTLGGVQFNNVWLDPGYVARNALAPRGGTDGADTIIGTAGADVIAASAGDDQIYTIAGEGVDVVEFGRGSGHDRVSTATLGIGYGEGALMIRLAAGIAPAAVGFAMTTDGLLRLSLDGGVDTLLIDPAIGERNADNMLVGGTMIAFADGTTLAVAELVDRLLVGSTGDDVLVGDDRDQVLRGGAGDDLLLPGGGHDVIRFDSGDGHDVVRGTGGGDEVAFGEGIEARDLSFRFSGDGRDLVITIAGSDGRLVIERFFAPEGGATAGVPIARFTFADGTSLDWDAVAEQTRGTDYSGDDVVRGGPGGAELAGGSGDDRLLGGTGSDLYRFNRGDGEDRILEAGGSEDTIRFGPGISPEGVRFSRVPGHPADLLIEIDGSERLTLTIQNQFAGETHRIEWFTFADGASLGWQDVQTTILARGITPGADTVTGFDGDDRIDARAGNDTLSGGRGDDLLIGGDGFDTVVLTGRPEDYDIVAEGEGFRVTDRIVGRDGSDLLMGVEAVRYGPSLTSTLLSGEPQSWSIRDVSFTIAEDGGIAFSDADLLAAFDNPGGSALRIELLPLVGSTIWSPAAGQYQYAPNADFHGLEVHRFAVVDAAGHRAVASLRFEVTPVNDAPLTMALSVRSFEDGEAEGRVIAVDADGNALAFAVADKPAHGVVTIDAASGAFRYVADADFAGTDRFTVTVTDEHGASTTSHVEVTLDPLNDAPVLARPLEDRTGEEDVRIDFALPPGTFVDVDGDRLAVTATLASGEPLPSWLRFADGRFTGTPPTNFHGTLLLGVTASDGDERVSGTFALAITPVNDPVIATGVPERLQGTEDVGFAFRVETAMFSDVDGDVLTYGITLADGTALPNWLGFDGTTLSGTPPQDLSSTVALRLSASDGTTSASVPLILALANVNDAPVAGAPLPVVHVSEDAPLAYALPTDVFHDIDGDVLALTATLADGNPLPEWLRFANGGFIGTPPANWHGALDLLVRASDGSLSAMQSLRIVVDPVNDAPAAGASIGVIHVPEDGRLDIGLPADSFTDVDGDILTLTAARSDGGALPSWLRLDGLRVTGTPPADFHGTLDLVVRASDGSAFATQALRIVVDPVNDAPIAGEALATVRVAEDSSVAYALPAGAFADIDGDALTLTATLANDAPLPTWLRFDGARFDGTPPADWHGTLDLIVRASDGSLSATQPLRIIVDPVNDAPVVALPLTDVTTRGGEQVRIVVPTGSFADVDGDALTLTATLAGGSVLPSWLRFDAATGLFSGTAPTGGAALSIRVTASDGALTARDDFLLSIAASAPVAGNDSTSVDQGRTSANLYDLLLRNDGTSAGALTITAIDTQGTDGHLTFDAAGQVVTYAALGAAVDRLAPGQTYVDRFTYTVSDGSGGAATATVSITVTGVEQPGVTWSGGNGDDTYAGTNGKDVLSGGNGNDRISGLAGADRIYGGNGDDWLDGGAGSDLLEGGNGNDVLLGGTGDDVLTGGNGADRFVFAEMGGTDRISDFARGDRIDLSGLDAVAGTPTNDAFRWIGSGAFSRQAGELRLVSVGGTWTLTGDVDGDGVADFTILSNAPLTQADVVL